jgi:hypothetical protein
MQVVHRGEIEEALIAGEPPPDPGERPFADILSRLNAALETVDEAAADIATTFGEMQALSNGPGPIIVEGADAAISRSSVFPRLKSKKRDRVVLHAHCSTLLAGEVDDVAGMEPPYREYGIRLLFCRRNVRRM